MQHNQATWTDQLIRRSFILLREYSSASRNNVKGKAYIAVLEQQIEELRHQLLISESRFEEERKTRIKLELEGSILKTEILEKDAELKMLKKRDTDRKPTATDHKR